MSVAGSFHQLQPSHQRAPLWALPPVPPPGFVHLIQAFSHSQQLLVEAFCRSLQNKALPSSLSAYGPGRVPQICPAYSRRKPALAWGAPLFFLSLVRISNLLPFSFLETFHSRNGGMENGVFSWFQIRRAVNNLKFLWCTITQQKGHFLCLAPRRVE